MIEIWKQIQRENFHNWRTLVEFLQLTPEQCRKIESATQFNLSLPLRLAKKIRKSTLEDPILRQFVPTTEEEFEVIGFVKSPLKEETFNFENRLLKKYYGKALLLVTQACSMHCRYCFRRHFSYYHGDNSFKAEISAISEDKDILHAMPSN